MHRTYVWGLAASLYACSSSNADPGNNQLGNLGQGKFSYVCVTEDDPVCPSGSLYPNTFPAAVAQGGQFRITFSGSDSLAKTETGRPTIAAASPEFISVLGETMTALRPGYAGVLAKSTVDDRVVDFTMLLISPVSALRLSTPLLPTPKDLSLKVGEKVEVRARALGLSGEPLAGRVGGIWKVSDPKVVSIDSAEPASQVTVWGVMAGQSLLTATVGSTEASLSVVVSN